MGKMRKLLSKLEKNINSALEMTEVGIWEYDIKKDVAYWTDQMYSIFGIDKTTELTIKNMFEKIHLEDYEYAQNVYKQAIRTGKPYIGIFRILREDGSIRYLKNHAEVTLDENREAVSIFGITVDITEQTVLGTKISENDIQIKEVSEFLEVGIWAADKINDKMLFCSKGVETISGYPVSDFMTNKLLWIEVIHPDDKKKYRLRQRKLRAGKTPLCFYRIIRKDGEIRWVQDQTIPTLDSHNRLIRLDGALTDITEQKKSEERLTYLAKHDYLTKLPNRRMFEEELRDLTKGIEERGLEIKFAVLFLDLDDFKRINDAFGHHAGDEILKGTALRIKQSIGKNVVAARMGGDEFALLFKDVGHESELRALAKNLINKISDPFFIEGYELYVTVSIGVVLYPDGTSELKKIVEKSDMALYRAKELGKNHFSFYNISMEKEYKRLYMLEQELRKAIKMGKLTIHYQPKVDLHLSKVIGVEALLRWHHEKLGMISPAEFIPMAEENGLIFEVTDWTFKTVCEQIKEWESKGIPVVPVSINISPKRFLQNNWFDIFVNIIEETDVNPKLLELEITESALIENDKAFFSYISKLKEIGMKISLDDFGTGYSSPVYLKNYLIDTIKIDQLFIREILEKNAPIIKYIIDLAHQLKMNVIAEGVETEEQLHFLKENGCNQIQGYIFCKPVPAHEVVKVLLGEGEAYREC